MDETYGNDYITIMDEDGFEIELEHLDTFEMNGEVYFALLPSDVEEDSDEYGVVMLKVIEEDGEELFIDIEDDDELKAAFELYVKRCENDSVEID